MTIATLIVDVAANTAQLSHDVNDINAKFDTIEKSAFRLGQALGAMFAIGKIIDFGRELLSTADALEKLHDKTGISEEGLQRLQIAGDDAGNSIEQLAKAINFMQRNLAEGQSGAIGALRQLGIGLDEIKLMSPDEQFIAIGKAIQGVKDPSEQVALAMRLFGRTGAEVLPTLKADLDKVKDAFVMSAGAVKGLDALGDSLTRIWRVTKGWAGEIAGVVASRFFADIKSLQIFFGSMPDLPAAPKLAINAALPLAGPADMGKVREMTQALEEVQRSLEKAAAAAKKFREGVESLSFKTYVAEAFPMVGLIQDLSDRSGAFREHLDDLTSSFNEFHGGITIAGDEMESVTIPMFTTLPNVVAQGTKQLDRARESMKATTSVLDALDHVLSGIHGRFGDVVGIAVRAATEIAKIANKASEAGEALTKGDWLKIAAIGISAVVSAFSRLFGNNPEKQINPIREAFVQAAGGLARLNARAHEAGITLDHLLNAKNPEAYKAAIDELNAAFQFQDNAMKTLDDTVAKYGFTLAELPVKFRQGKLDEQFMDLYKDQQVLLAGGFDFDAILQKQASSFQDLINVALTTGATIPAQLQPAIERLIAMGLLTDTAGEKLTDVSQLTFAETLDAKFNTLLDTIQKLVDAITRGLGGAIAALPDQKVVHISYQADDFPDVGATRMASGGFGHATGPMLFSTQGNEDFAFSGEGKRFGAAGGSSTVDLQALNDQVRGLREDLARQNRLLPKAIRDAVLLAA